jgi:hypothetical protein
MIVSKVITSSNLVAGARVPDGSAEQGDGQSDENQIPHT